MNRYHNGAIPMQFRHSLREQNHCGKISEKFSLPAAPPPPPPAPPAPARFAALVPPVPACPARSHCAIGIGTRGTGGTPNLGRGMGETVVALKQEEDRGEES